MLIVVFITRTRTRTRTHTLISGADAILGGADEAFDGWFPLMDGQTDVSVRLQISAVLAPLPATDTHVAANGYGAAAMRLACHLGCLPGHAWIGKGTSLGFGFK